MPLPAAVGLVYCGAGNLPEMTTETNQKTPRCQSLLRNSHAQDPFGERFERGLGSRAAFCPGPAVHLKRFKSHGEPSWPLAYR